MFTYDPFVFASYERFLLYQYQIQTDGLFFNSGHYYILCPLTTEHSKSSEGNTIHDWVHDNKIMGTTISIVNKLPEGTIRVDDQVAFSKSSANGYLITRGDLEYEIDLMIPKIFPDYEVQINYPIVNIIFNENVTDEGILELNNIFSTNGFPLRWSFSSDSNSHPKKPINTFSSFQYITTFRNNKNNLPNNVSLAWEEDEDNWSSERQNILTGAGSSRFYNDTFSKDKLRGLIDCTTIPPDNIRNYLSIFGEVSIVLPNAETLSSTLSALDVSQDEFCELMAMKKAHVLLPESIEKYDVAFIDRLLETNNENVHLSRKLTTLSFIEESKRNPLFFPFIPTIEKQQLLQSLEQSLTLFSGDHKANLQRTIGKLGGGWHSIPGAINQMGSSFVSQFGIAELLRLLLEIHHGKDYSMELLISAPPVGWAAATGSVLIPAENTDFSTAPFCEMMALLYSGVPDENWILKKPSYANFAIEELLVISDKIPVLEFAKSFSAGQVTRFRELILSISKNNSSAEDLEETINAFNHFVKEYEKNKKHLGVWNIGGFVLGQLGKVSGSPYASWLTKFLVKLLEKQSSKSKTLGSIIDKLEGQLQGAFPSAILVSKMKDKLKKHI